MDKKYQESAEKLDAHFKKNYSILAKEAGEEKALKVWGTYLSHTRNLLELVSYCEEVEKALADEKHLRELLAKMVGIACELLADGYGDDWASGRYEVNGKTIKFIPKKDAQMWKDLLDEIAKENTNDQEI